MNRRQFLRTPAAAAALWRCDRLGAACNSRLRFGVAQFDKYDPLRDIAQLDKWGFDYCEPQVVKIMTLSEAEFQSQLNEARATRIRVEAMNVLMPGDLKVVGPQVDQARIRDYIQKAFARANALGAKVIVFGSGESRRVPEGFNRERAWLQLQEFLHLLGGEIEKNGYGMVIGIEALRHEESNILNTSSEAYNLAVQTNHPKVHIIVDFFHLASEGEDPAILPYLNNHIVHLHFADASRGRLFPRTDSIDPRYAAFFSAIREIGFDGRLSLEAYTNDFETDAPAGLEAVRKLRERSCGG
ncbi:MAG: sugar phosphate isomerase/epimerase [Acidobacteriaceae bacterium]|nr:sugar phosphate isomerase/epimerase [Acidobacteriaceae bacterium]